MKKINTAILLTALIIGLIWSIVPEEELYKLAHRIKHGNDRVYYHDRTYYSPIIKTFDDLPVPGDELIPTGEKVIGLPVMDTPSSMQFQKERNVVPVLLILKQSDDYFLVYVLSGGP